MTDTITTNTTPDHAGVNLLPPMVLFAMLVVSLGLDYVMPLKFGFGMMGTLIGMMFAIDSVILVVLCAATLKKAGTNVPPNRPTKVILTDGIYRFSRNPIYVGFILGHAALALLFDTIWLAGMLPVFFLYLDRYVVPREEAYLTRKFGQRYTDYCAKVRRWF